MYYLKNISLTSVLAHEQVMAVQRKQLMSSITTNMTPSAMARYSSHGGWIPLSVQLSAATAEFVLADFTGCTLNCGFHCGS